MAKKKDIKSDDAVAVERTDDAVAVERTADENDNVKVEFKQVVVGVVILCFALLMLVMSFPELKKSCWLAPFFGHEKYEPYKPTNVMVVLGTTTEKDVDYQIYYTVVRETWFNEEHVAELSGKTGTHYYVINLPVEQIHKFRLDFGSNPGKVTVHNIRLMGTQSADLSDFNAYEYRQMNDVEIADGKVSFDSFYRDPFMIYNHRLLP